MYQIRPTPIGNIPDSGNRDEPIPRCRVRACHLNPAAVVATSGFLDEQRALWERRLDRLHLLTMDDT